MTWQSESSKSLGYWTLSLHFLRLAEASCALLAATENPHVVISKAPLGSNEYSEATLWSDHSVGIAILFTFFHGIELILKGFISVSDTAPNHHRLTELLTTFEKSQQNTDLAKTISANVRSIDPNSPLGTFMTNNSIQIDKWFEALKYPESTKGQSFSHIDLKYGGLDTVPFWQSIGEAARQVRLQAVALSRERGYV